jgi:hypothetical protein
VKISGTETPFVVKLVFKVTVYLPNVLVNFSGNTFICGNLKAPDSNDSTLISGKMNKMVWAHGYGAVAHWLLFKGS